MVMFDVPCQIEIAVGTNVRTLASGVRGNTECEERRMQLKSGLLVRDLLSKAREDADIYIGHVSLTLRDRVEGPAELDPVGCEIL
jgi:hypothetical protein